MADLHDWGTGEAPKPPRSFPPDPRPKWHVVPKTLDDLLQRAGPYADATRTHLAWGAITTWLMNGEADKALAGAGLPTRVASLSVFLTRAAEEREAGWPNLTGLTGTPALYGYSQPSQSEARRSAAEVHALWVAAGRPHLDAKRIQWAFQYLVACIRAGVIPPLPTIGAVPPLNS